VRQAQIGLERRFAETDDLLREIVWTRASTGENWPQLQSRAPRGAPRLQEFAWERSKALAPVRRLRAPRRQHERVDGNRLELVPARRGGDVVLGVYE
jgi:hypothetical protein